MKSMSEKEFAYRMKQIQRENATRLRIQELRAEEDKYKSKFKLPSWSKMLAVYLFLVLNIVLAYAMVAMWHFNDLQYLGVLITDVAAQILTFLIYAHKSTVENTVGGITYDLAMKEREMRGTDSGDESTD